MIKKITLIIVFLLLISSISISAMIYETGYLRNKVGQAVDGVTLDMRFRLYKGTGSSGVLVWTSLPQSVRIYNGMYSVLLTNNTTPLDENIISTNEEYYLEYLLPTGADAFQEKEIIGYVPRAIMSSLALKAASMEAKGLTGAIKVSTSNLAMAITISGSVGIGTLTPSRKLSVNGDAGGTGAWFNDSDKRLKKNITEIENALEKVKKLRGVRYEWKDKTNHSEGQQIGFIAQEVINIVPEVVSKPGEYYSMQYAPITALLTEAIKEQQKLIDQLRKELNELKALKKKN